MNSLSDKTLQLIGNRRIRAFAIGVIVLGILAVLQVNNLKRKTPMCELLSNARLSDSDLQRIQIALSQSGLGDYEMQENTLLVPESQHAIYLQAVAAQDAVPADLKTADEIERPTINPFLSRSQQLSIERAEKKHQIRDMVMRLPFVDQAWFEMDKSDTRSAFEAAEQSAVISIRTPQNLSLSEQHVDTVKRMIGGAVAGLDFENIQVIDLGTGFAYQDSSFDPEVSQQIQFRRIAFEQQRFYENKIRETLSEYPGINVSVFVDVKKGEPKIAMLPTLLPVAPAKVQLPSAGANSFASIDDFRPAPEPTIELVTHVEPVSNPAPLEKQISVSIDVPQKLVHQLFGAPVIPSKMGTKRSDLRSAMSSETQAKFEQLRAEIVEKVKPMLPRSNFQDISSSPISINLIREPIVDSMQWTAQVKEFATKNWPSAAVLIIGLMLLSIVTRKPDYVPTDQEPTHDHVDVVSLNTSVEDPTNGANSEVRLTNLIEQDPDAAAKVIQAWIRDAA